MNLTFHPVSNERWRHFEELFECKGAPHYCWCMLWRANENKKELPGKAGKKKSMQTRVSEGIPVGLLGYLKGVPVAWCSIAPRETFRPLGGDETKQGVWSITYFFVKRSMRNQGLTSQLLDAAIQYAKESGAGHLEAYPVASDSPTYRYMGVMPLFEKAGFKFVKKAGERRNVMILKLS